MQTSDSLCLHAFLLTLTTLPGEQRYNLIVNYSGSSRGKKKEEMQLLSVTERRFNVLITVAHSVSHE